mgnify:FL=1
MTPTQPIGPVQGMPPAEPARPAHSETPRSQEAPPEHSAPLQDAAVRSGQAVDPAELQAATDRLNDYAQKSSRVHFKVGEGDLMVQVVDSTTDEVIRSIPAEKVLEIRDHFRELTGLLLDDRA